IGADDAVRIDAAPTDAFFVAGEMAAYARGNGYDLILTGKETINYNGSQVPGMMAAILDWPFVSNASKMDVGGNAVTLERDAQGGVELVEADLPMVVSAAKGMAEQRIPNMRGIMAARTKPLNVVQPKGGDKLTETVSY